MNDLDALITAKEPERDDEIMKEALSYESEWDQTFVLAHLHLRCTKVKNNGNKKEIAICNKAEELFMEVN